jgi:hypothetical protein
MEAVEEYPRAVPIMNILNIMNFTISGSKAICC